MQQVTVVAQPIAELEQVLGPARYQQFGELAERTTEAFRGRAVINVNSTASGGGVAEMLHTLLAYSRGAGIDARWMALEAPPEFFDITKRVHNRIYGVRGDPGALGETERRLYEHVLAGQMDDLVGRARPQDLVVLHDPQTLGLAPALKAAGVPVVWRCHIGADRPNEFAADGWQFLAPYLYAVDAVVVSRDAFAPPGYAREQVWVIPPSIDPLAVKNAPLTVAETSSLLAFAGLVQGDGDSAVFRRRDGSAAAAVHRAVVVGDDPPPPADAPLVVQVSRWDRLKDMPGVLTGFVRHVPGDAHLVLAGPDVSGVADDPEGVAVFGECTALWATLPPAARARVHLVCLPTADGEENAAYVNALQRHAAVVVQKSLAEGFGLTVVEAMWKARPVVASAVGGIVDQIADDDSGALLEDPADLATFGDLVTGLLTDHERAARVGGRAQERARDFLPDLHLEHWATLLTGLAT